MTLETRERDVLEVVGAAIEVERLATGIGFGEGPVWDRAGKRLVFSDMKHDHMRSWRAGEGIATFRKPSNKANGNTYDRQGRLLSCEHATSRVVRQERDGSMIVLASHYRDKELNSPNDIVVKSDGAIYFSDPTYGRIREDVGVPRELQLGFRGVYRVAGEGAPTSSEQGSRLRDANVRESGAVPSIAGVASVSGVTSPKGASVPPSDGAPAQLLADDFEQPNGLCFSLDEKTLFINDTVRGHVRVFDVGLDGTLTGGRIWAELSGEGEGRPDGMKIDSAGNLYCTGPGGVHVLDPNARCLGVIRMPERVTNIAWGDDDLRSLYVTGITALYRVRIKTPGRLTY